MARIIRASRTVGSRVGALLATAGGIRAAVFTIAGGIVAMFLITLILRAAPHAPAGEVGVASFVNMS